MFGVPGLVGTLATSRALGADARELHELRHVISPHHDAGEVQLPAGFNIASLAFSPDASGGAARSRSSAESSPELPNTSAGRVRHRCFGPIERNLHGNVSRNLSPHPSRRPRHR
jgi:hypothetical protein